MFLSHEELVQLTGRRQSTSQVKALRFMGIEHKIRPDGSVAVLAEHVKDVMGMTSDGPSRKEKEWEPDWENYAQKKTATK